MAKRTERFWMPRQINTDERMAREIRLGAEIDHRSLQGQIMYLLTLGLEQWQLRSGNVNGRVEEPTASHAITSVHMQPELPLTHIGTQQHIHAQVLHPGAQRTAFPKAKRSGTGRGR